MKTKKFPLYKIAMCDLYDENSDSELKVPNIQRGLVWKAQQMELLWDSILREFPVGSMLALKNEDHYDILDGQQRANGIITGFNVANILNKEKSPTSILWIDLSFNQIGSDAEFRKYGIRLTNSAHPWGFEENGGKLSASKRRAALRAAYGDDYPTSKRDWDIRRFVPFAFSENESFLPVPLAFLVSAARNKRIDKTDDIENFWSEFAKSLDDFSKFSAQWEKRYHSKVSDYITQNRNNKDFIEPFFKLNEYEIIFNYVDCADEIEVLFNRINKQGTVISNSELAYSAIKHYGADICDNPEIGKVIKRESDGLMIEHNLAQILFRYCFSLQNIKGEIDAKIVRRFKTLADHHDEATEDECRIITELRACFGQYGYLHGLIDESKKILLSSADGCPLPSFLYAEIADKNPELILLLLRLTQKHRVELEDDSPGFIQALIFYLYCFSNDKTPIYSIFKASNTLNFEKRTVTNILRDAITEGKCIPIVSSFKGFPALDENEFYNYWSEERYSDSRGYLAFRRLFDYGTTQGFFMLKFVQRHYYQRYFGDYNPSIKELWDEINRPWDHDHIIPQNWTAEGDWKDVCLVWINSIGNIADIPFEQNRGKSDDADWHYYLEVTNDLQEDNLLYFDRRTLELDEKALQMGIESEVKKFLNLTKERFLKITDDFLSIFDILELDRELSPMQQERKNFFLAITANKFNAYQPYYLEQSGKEYLIENIDDNYYWQRPWVSAMSDADDDPLWRKAITVFIYGENSSFLVERGLRKQASLDLRASNNLWWKAGTYRSLVMKSIVNNGRLTDCVNWFVFGADIFNANGPAGFIADSSGFLAYEEVIDGIRLHARIFEYRKNYFYCSIKTIDGTQLPSSVLELFSDEKHWNRIGGNSEIECKLWRIDDICNNCYKFHGLMMELHSIKGCPSGFQSLDSIIGGFRPSQLTVIASNHEVGKTTFALNIARHAAVEYNIPTAIFSLQSSSHSVVMRLMAATCNIDFDTIAEELKQENEDSSFRQKLDELQKAPLWIDDTPSLTVMEFRTRTERLVKEKKVKLIIVDFLQLMLESEDTTQEQDVNEIVKYLKETAQELNVSIIILSLLRRIHHDDSGLSVYDLPYADIEEKSDVIMLIDYQGDNVYDSEIRTVSVVKNDNGQTGEAQFRFLFDIFKFIEVDAKFGTNV